MKASADEFVTNEGIEKLENSLNEKLGKGYAEIINVPPSMPLSLERMRLTTKLLIQII